MPFTLLIIFLLLYLNFRNLTDCQPDRAVVGAVALVERDLADVVAQLRTVGRSGSQFLSHWRGVAARNRHVIMPVYLEHAWEGWLNEWRSNTNYR